MIQVGAATDQAVLRQVFGCFPTGVVAVCVTRDGAPVGMVVSSFVSVSLSPPLVSVCIAHTSRTWPRLRAAGRLGVSVLGEEHGPACRQLAAGGPDRFTGVGWDSTPGGAVRVTGSSAFLECVVVGEHSAGDHDIVVLRIVGVRAEPDVPPLVFHGSRFRRLGAERVVAAAPAAGGPVPATAPAHSQHRMLDHIFQVVAAGSS